MPPVTEDRRKELAKEAKALGEEGKVGHTVWCDVVVMRRGCTSICISVYVGERGGCSCIRPPGSVGDIDSAARYCRVRCSCFCGTRPSCRPTYFLPVLFVLASLVVTHTSDSIRSVYKLRLRSVTSGGRLWTRSRRPRRRKTWGRTRWGDKNRVLKRLLVQSMYGVLGLSVSLPTYLGATAMFGKEKILLVLRGG